MTEPLLLLPGLACDARVFFHQIVSLSLSRAVMVLPLKGAIVEEMSQAVLAQAPPRFALCGTGLGGTVALDVIRRAPERVTRVVLISTDPFSETPQAAAAREARIVAARAGRVREAMTSELPAAALFNGAARAEVQEVVGDMARVLGADAFISQSRAMQRRPDHQKTLRRFLLPALMIAGAADMLVPPRRQEFTSELMPKGRFMLVNDAGHLPTMESPEAVSEAVDAFLDEPLMLR
ncbi:MAG: alpha/beta hydrolase [Cereibacter sphaeroides]|uniref:Alpha/beta hydrolase n=1 Tax=Cereibacter sphaeroides TaxID=1063 RepID=A0A2W5S4U4_CERSP|nr:MAG: alpha/beta hydrolase [Cereibacter sphaeroides]